MNKIRTPLTAERIVDASITLIRESGVEALSMRALATSLGVTAPALYAHFTSRDQLLRACAQVGYDALDERFQKEKPESPVEMIWVSSRSYVHFALDEPELFSLMFMFRPEAIEIAVEADVEHDGATTVFNSMIHNLGLAIESGELRPADPLEYGLALWASVHGVATVATLAPGLAVDPLLDTVVGGLIAGWST
ncbi:MAG: AcrR family transcriptional regulator [Candidatus Aldehydirespiratoraceae bacterium]|jgi:AcrR family transcriptional regulator